MSLKLCFNEDIHRVSKLPVSISALNETVASTFPSITGAWTLRYDDSDGDRITLKTDDDLKALYAQQKADGKTIKIIVSTSNSVDLRRESIASDKSFEVVQNVPNPYQQSREEQKVSDITGGKVIVVPVMDEAAPEEKNWMKKLPERVQVFKLTKKLLAGGFEEPKKQKVQKEVDEMKSKLSPEDLQWLEKKMSCLDEKGNCKKGSHSRSKDKVLPPKKEAKHISKRLFFMKAITPEEKKALETRLIELEAVITPEEKEELASKQAKWAAKAEKKKEKKKKLVHEFSSFVKDNIEGLLEISGIHKHKHFKHHGAMKKLGKELLETYTALPTEKKAVVSELLNGIPEKMIALSKAKEEKKAAFHGMSKEEKCDWKAKKVEERMKRHQEKSEKRTEREAKSKSKEKKSKSPEKKTPNPILREARKFSPNSEKKIAILREVFPDIDVDQAKIFIDANSGLGIDELIQSMISSTIKK